MNREIKDRPLSMPCSEPEGCKHFKEETRLNELIFAYESVEAPINPLFAENKRLREAFTSGLYTPLNCLDILSKAANHYLTEHDCDHHGYECVSLAAKTAKSHIVRITQALKETK